MDVDSAERRDVLKAVAATLVAGAVGAVTRGARVLMITFQPRPVERWL